MTSPSHDYEAWAQQAQAVQAELNEARIRLMESEVTGTSGLVTVSLGATGDLLDIRIEGGQASERADLRRDILAAHARAVAAARAMAEDMIRPVQHLIGSMERAGD